MAFLFVQMSMTLHLEVIIFFFIWLFFFLFCLILVFWIFICFGLFYDYALDPCCFSKERQKWCGFGWEVELVEWKPQSEYIM